MSSNATETPKPTTKKPDGDGSKASEDEKKDESIFECNICLDTARDAVVSMCGHLFW